MDGMARLFDGILIIGLVVVGYFICDKLILEAFPGLRLHWLLSGCGAALIGYVFGLTLKPDE